MKFYCDSCNTKYAISDDKVRGKVLKVRCKHCGDIITVRELEAVASPPVQAPTPSTNIPQTNWHYSINGVSNGPMGLATLKAKYAAGEIGDETYVWHDSYEGWIPVATDPIFAESLRQGFAKKPRFETNSYTGVQQAVENTAPPSQQRAGVPPQRVSSSPAVNEPNQPHVENSFVEPKAPENAALPSFNAPPGSNSMFPGDPLPTFSDSLRPEEETGDNLPTFGDDKPKDIFDPKADTYGLDSNADSQPFFPEDANPSLGGGFDAISEVFTSSKSLLIQIDKIRKTDRKKSLVFFLIGFVVFLIIAGVGTYMYLNRDIAEEVVVEKVKEREAKMLAYSKNDMARFLQLEDEIIRKDDVLPDEEDDPEYEDEIEPKPTFAKSNGKNGKKPRKGKEIAKNQEGDKGRKNAKAPKLTKEEEIRRKLLNIGGPPVRPEDNIGKTNVLKAGLNRVQAQAGFKKVSRSVSTCRQRHASRSGKELKSAKVKISVEVMPTGKVSTFSISPAELRHTAFDSCMTAKRPTWRFAKFGGKSVKINRTFILQ